MGWDGLAQAHTPHRHSLLEGVTASPASALSAKIGISLLLGLGTSSAELTLLGLSFSASPFVPRLPAPGHAVTSFPHHPELAGS